MQSERRADMRGRPDRGKGASAEERGQVRALIATVLTAGRRRYSPRGSVLAAALLGSPSALGLPIALGPYPDTDRIGPNGSQIHIVQDPNTFGLTGAGVRIGQIEPGQPRDTHVAFSDGAGGSRITLSAPGNSDDHATGVAGILIGNPPAGNPGIPAGVATSARLFSTRSTPNFVGGVGFLMGNGVQVINQSSGLVGESNGQSVRALIVDRTVRESNIVYVKSAGNEGPGARTITIPGDAFNAITVGRTGQNAFGASAGDYTRVFNSSSRGPTDDGRHKPDIVAPGSRILMPGAQDDTATRGPPLPSGTSFAAPQVAGTAALIIERAASAGLSYDHLATKAVLLNSASKHVRDPRMGDRTWPDFRAASGTDVPLDNAMGVGQLNGLAAIRQTQGSDQRGLSVETSTISRDETRTVAVDGDNVLGAGSLVVATLTWDRPVTLRPGGNPAVAADYRNTALPNLNLELVRGGTVVATSNSGGNAATGGDSVEHLYFNVRESGQYRLRVVNRAGDQDVPFALAQSAGSAEGLSFSVDGGAFNARRRTPPGPGTAFVAANPSEGLMAPFRTHVYPNDVNALGTAGPGNFPTEGEIFVANCNAISTSRPDCTGVNVQRLSGALGTRSRVGPHNGPPAGMAVLEAAQRGVLGLQPNDNVIGLSWGKDGTAGKPSVLAFSVDPDTQGERGDVRFQALLSPVGGAAMKPFPANPGGGGRDERLPGAEAAGDIFKSPRLDRFGAYGSDPLTPAPARSNRLFIDEGDIGLQAPRDRGSLLRAEEDDLDGLELDSVRVVDMDGDGMHNAPVFFALDRWSPSLLGDFSADDIFVSMTRDPNLLDFDLLPTNPLLPFDFGIYAKGIPDIRLQLGDAIDALVLSDVLRPGVLDPRVDEALFSLDRFSPSIEGSGACPSDIYYTDFVRAFNPTLDWKAGGSLFASAGALGLLCTVDNVDALDIRTVGAVMSAPGSLLLVGTVLLLLAIARRRAHHLC